MKKKYIIPTLEVIQTETEALLEASLELIDDDANGDGMTSSSTRTKPQSAI